jgi:single-strand DNA-binding protein
LLLFFLPNKWSGIVWSVSIAFISLGLSDEVFLINPSFGIERGLIRNTPFNLLIYKMKVMQQFTGRITADAKVSTVKGDKQLVSFSVADNDRYHNKSTGETKEYVTYYNIAWWKGTGVSKILRKGAIVTITGRLEVNVYTDKNGKAQASLNCHANDIKLVQGKKAEARYQEASELTEPLENLPF